AMPLLGRAILSDRAGFMAAGHFALVGEIGMRLFQNLGSALDLALFQLAVRAEETDGSEAADRQTGTNLAFVAALVVPAATGLCLVWPAFESVFVPAAFRGELWAVARWTIPGLAAYALVQYGLNPMFQLRRRTGPVVAAALAGLAVNAACLVLLPGTDG